MGIDAPVAAPANGPGLRLGEEWRPLCRMRTLVGRFDPVTRTAPDIDLTIQDDARRVSRRHAEIEWIDGVMQLKDLGSTNGTWRNGVRLEPFKQVVLLEGDELVFGLTPCAFSASAPWPPEVQPEWEARTLTGSLVTHPEPQRLLATVLFVDLVRSTERAVTSGGKAWQALLTDFYVLSQRCIVRHRGREAGKTGDGVVAVFPSPVDALRCALELGERVADLGMQVRCGVHYGEFDELPGTISGATVHAAARICSRALPGAVLVSRTVRELALDSGLIFADRGPHLLKGLPTRWRLFNVMAAQRADDEGLSGAGAALSHSLEPA